MGVFLFSQNEKKVSLFYEGRQLLCLDVLSDMKIVTRFPLPFHYSVNLSRSRWKEYMHHPFVYGPLYGVYEEGSDTTDSQPTKKDACTLIGIGLSRYLQCTQSLGRGSP